MDPYTVGVFLALTLETHVGTLGGLIKISFHAFNAENVFHDLYEENANIYEI